MISFPLKFWTCRPHLPLPAAFGRRSRPEMWASFYPLRHLCEKFEYGLSDPKDSGIYGYGGKTINRNPQIVSLFLIEFMVWIELVLIIKLISIRRNTKKFPWEVSRLFVARRFLNSKIKNRLLGNSPYISRENVTYPRLMAYLPTGGSCWNVVWGLSHFPPFFYDFFHPLFSYDFMNSLLYFSNQHTRSSL